MPSFINKKFQWGRLLSMITGILTLLLGLTVIIGWYARIPVLIQVLPGFAPMQFNAALGFLFSGIGLVLSNQGRPKWGYIGGGLVFLIGFLTLSQYAFSFDLGIDQLFMDHYITVETSHPGRMAPNTALAFSLSGIAFLLISQPAINMRRWLYISLLSSLVLALGSVAFFGYLSNLQTAYGWGNLTRMAVHTSLGFGLISLSMFFLPWRGRITQKDLSPPQIALLLIIPGSTFVLILWQAVLAEEQLSGNSTAIPAVVLIAGGLLVLFAISAAVFAQTARQQAELLRQSEERFRRMVEAAPLPINIHTEDGEIVLMNQAWFDQTGYSPDDVNSMEDWLNLAFGTKKAKVQKKINSLFDITGVIDEGESTVKTHSGDERIWWFRSTLLGKDELGKRMMMSMATDITERRRLIDELSMQVAAVERSNAELQQFAYVASHDLQEPLRKIVTFGDRLHTKFGPTLGEQGSNYLDRMQSAAKRMRKLIDELLNYSRVSTQSRPFEAIDLNLVAQDVVSDLEILISEMDAVVNISSLPTVQGDPTQMHSLLQNLIGNSLKFHRPEVVPNLKVYQLSNGNKQRTNEDYEIVIEDNGIGFDEKYLDRIFIPFKRLHSRTEYPGTGVGLAICRKIVERHNGTISAQSKLGEGTKFFISLPRKLSIQEGRQSQ